MAAVRELGRALSIRWVYCLRIGMLMIGISVGILDMVVGLVFEVWIFPSTFLGGIERI